jgi:hypothetical protein
MKAKLVVVCVLAAVLQACSSDGGSSGGGSSPGVQDAQAKCANTPANPGFDARYVISETTNGTSCTTGCQIFDSPQAYCNGLENDALNNNCARDAREEDFAKNCR